MKVKNPEDGGPVGGDIVPVDTYVQFLKDKFDSLTIPVYKLRAWFSMKHQVFFDCESEDAAVCLNKLLKRKN